MSLYGAVEAGGTKFLCAVGTGPDHLEATLRIPTTTPEETLARVIAFFRPFAKTLKAIGIGSFGPLDLDPGSPTFGTIPTTPKPGWSGVNLLRPFREAFEVPIGLTTDVQAAALGGRAGPAHFRLSDGGHRHRGRRHRPRPDAPRGMASGDGPHPDPP